MLAKWSNAGSFINYTRYWQVGKPSPIQIKLVLPMQLIARGGVFTDFDFAHLINGIKMSTTLPSNNAIPSASSCASVRLPTKTIGRDVRFIGKKTSLWKSTRFNQDHEKLPIVNIIPKTGIIVVTPTIGVGKIAGYNPPATPVTVEIHPVIKAISTTSRSSKGLMFFDPCGHLGG